jgi:hypothetical protein
MKEIDYQDVLNQQEIYGEELNLFANKEKHKEVSEWTYIYWYIYFLNKKEPNKNSQFAEDQPGTFLSNFSVVPVENTW